MCLKRLFFPDVEEQVPGVIRIRERHSFRKEVNQVLSINGIIRTRTFKQYRIPIYGTQRLSLRKKNDQPDMTDAYCDKSGEPEPDFLD